MTNKLQVLYFVLIMFPRNLMRRLYILLLVFHHIHAPLQEFGMVTMHALNSMLESNNQTVNA